MKKPILRPADILLPQDCEMEKWSVIACDQFTSERAYWDRVAERTAGSPTTLGMIMPEAYLNDVSPVNTAAKTGAVMQDYLNGGLFKTLPDSYIYVEREVTGGVRHGLVGAVDLEAYDFTPSSKSPVRASERTVEERLPARMLIRESAPLELPHILVLIDDPSERVIEPLRREKSELPAVYDFDLMEGGGHISGWQVAGDAAARVSEALERLSAKELQYVVGDGNHSLAAAKELWNRVRKGLTEEERENHPARFALVEVNNVYDEGVKFEPIHRVVFNIDPALLLELMHEKLEVPDGREIKCVVDGKVCDTVRVRGKSFGRMVDALEEMIEEFAEAYDGTVDYIHDEEAVLRLTKEPGSVGFLLPAMDKSDLFKTVEHDGVFPKKSFSIGHAKDKRYYLECRRIK